MMAVSAAISEQAASLGVSILIGGALFLLYDIFRIFRRVVPHGNFWIGVEDFFYWLCCTAVVFVMLYRENDGMVRGFSHRRHHDWHAALLFSAQPVCHTDQCDGLWDGFWSARQNIWYYFTTIQKTWEKNYIFFQKTIEKSVQSS